MYYYSFLIDFICIFSVYTVILFKVLVILLCISIIVILVAIILILEFQNLMQTNGNVAFATITFIEFLCF